MSWVLFFAAFATGSVVPGLGMEALLIGAVAMVRGPAVCLLVVLAAATEVTGKVVIYATAAAGRIATSAARPVARWKIARWKVAQPGQSGACTSFAILISALASLPPFYATAIACGIARVGVMRFVCSSFAGRVLRYAALAIVTHFMLGGPR